MSIQVEPHDSSDFTARQQVFVRAFPETIGTSVETESHYRWKFHSKKAQPPSYEYSVKESGKLIGYYAAIPYVYSTPQGDFCAGMVCDVMTDPAHQGKGVFTKAGRFATEHMKEKGIDVTTGFPIRSEVIPGHLKVGWKALFPLPIYARVTGVETLPVLRKFPKVITRFFAVILRFFSRALELGRQGDFEMVEYSSIGQIPENELNALVKKWSKLQPIFLQKTKEFLSWRLSAPDVSYVVFGIKKNSRLVLLVIGRVTKLKDVKTLALLDWIEDEAANIPRARLAKEFRQIAARCQVDLIALMLNAPAARRLKLPRLGFLKTPIQFTFILKNLSQRFADDFFSFNKNWYLMWIDSDDL